MRLFDEIYAYEWMDPFENNCNSYYIGGDICALVDPGLTRQFPGLIERMKEDGLNPKDIKYVINTHSHPDHFEASEEFNGKDVKIGLHGKEIEFLEGIGSRMYGLFGLPVPSVDINFVLEEGPVTLGDETFEILLIPGHSPGSIGLYWPAAKALFSGDVIFDRNTGRTDLPGGNGKTLKESIISMSELDIDYLLPGHMGIVEGNEDVKRNFQFVTKNVFPYL